VDQKEKFLVFAIWAMTFGVVPVLYDPINLSRLIVLLLLSAAMLIQLLRKKLGISFTRKNTLILFLPVIGMIVSALFTDGAFFYDLTGYYQRSTGVLAYACLALLVLFVGVSSRNSINSFAKNLYYVISVFGVYLVLQLMNLDPFNWVTPYNKLIGTFGNPNFSAAFIGMLIPAVIYMHLARKNTWRYLDLFIVGVLFFLAASTESIQGPLIGIFSSICFLGIIFYNKRKILVTSISSAATLAFILTLLSVLKVVTITPLNNFLLVQGSGAQRLDFWRAGIQMFKDHPIFGLGPDGYARYFQFYRNQEQVIRDGALNRADQAHSVPIQMLANGGLILGITYLVFIVFITWTLFKLIKRNENIKLTALFGSIWLSYLLQSLISIDTLALTFFGYFAGGVILALGQLDKLEKVKANPRFRPARNALVILAIVGFGSSSLALFVSDARFNALMKSPQIDSEQAIKFSNTWPSSRMSFLLTTAVQAKGDFKSAEVIAKNASKYDPLLPEAWYLIGVSRNEQADSMGALEFVNKSLELDKLNTFFMLKKAYIEMDQNNFPGALETINKIESINPNQGGLPELIADYEKRSKL
jgi:O-antigen ligase